jgi:hypothetical protein
MPARRGTCPVTAPHNPATSVGVARPLHAEPLLRNVVRIGLFQFLQVLVEGFKPVDQTLAPCR